MFEIHTSWKVESRFRSYVVFSCPFPQLLTGMSIYHKGHQNLSDQTPWTTISPQPSRNLNYQGENTSCWIRIKENILSPNLLDVKLGEISPI